MKLHEDKLLFADIIERAAEHPSNGGLGISRHFIEKDYWIINALRNLAESTYSEKAVFKGGTSLSKAYSLGFRFSEDIDIAIIRDDDISDSKMKTIIRSTEKQMAKDLVELNHPESSKGSRYRKSFYSYPTINNSPKMVTSMVPGQLLIEINSFANPFPYQQVQIRSFVYEYLLMNLQKEIIEEFRINPFVLNVLDKRTTMTEKIVSLIRYSLSEDPIPELEGKMRHFYDLYYLMQDKECMEFLFSDQFKNNFNALISHDKEMFDKPEGWRHKSLAVSPLMTDFSEIWDVLKSRYETELPSLIFLPTFVSSDKIKENMEEILKRVKTIC